MLLAYQILCDLRVTKDAAEIYNLSNLTENIGNHCEITNLEEENRVPSTVALSIPAGYSDFTNSMYCITLPKLLAMYSTLGTFFKAKLLERFLAPTNL